MKNNKSALVNCLDNLCREYEHVCKQVIPPINPNGSTAYTEAVDRVYEVALQKYADNAK
jgi:hypothetical protein